MSLILMLNRKLHPAEAEELDIEETQTMYPLDIIPKLIKMVLKMVTNMIDTVQDIRLKNQPLVLMMPISQDENEKIRLLFEKMNNKSLNKLNKDWFYTNPYFTVKKLINK